MAEITSNLDRILGIPGSGVKTLLAALPRNMVLPQDLTLCVLDAERLDDPQQLALAEELGRREGQILFVLNKADLCRDPRSAVARTVTMLQDGGIPRPEVYPVSAEAARLMARVHRGDMDREDQRALQELYDRFAPGDNSLSALAATEERSLVMDGREISGEQLRIALTNTGLPLLEARLRALGARQELPEAESPNAGPVVNRPSGAEQPESAPLPPEEYLEEPEIEELPPKPPASEDNELDFSDIAAIFQELPPQADSASETEAAAEPPEPAPASENPEPTAVDLTQDIPISAAAHSFPELMAMAEKADCAGLLELARGVQSSAASQEEKEKALEALHNMYKAQELTELRTLTLDADRLDLVELQARADRISSGPYTVQVRTPYLELISQRMDEIHSRQLEEICQLADQADSRTLAQLREELDRRDCAELLKTECYRRIEARQDALDLEDLERITAGAEGMSEKELRALSVTLEANNWSPKYVTAYRHRISLLREAALVRELQGQMEELNVMERREVLSALEWAQNLELPARLRAVPLEQAKERLFRLDMLRLIALNNDFDLLDFEGIDNLRSQVAKTEVCDAARRTYLGRLIDRENNLILENTASRADLVRQLIGQHKLRMGDFSISTLSPDHAEQVNRLWSGTGMEQPRDIPVFVFYNASTFAFSGQRFWYKTGRDLAFLSISEIDHFQFMRQRLALNLQIVRKDNTYLLTEARISRGGAEKTLAFLNDCLRRWDEQGLAEAYPVNPIRTPRFEASDYAAPVPPVIPTPEMALDIFKDQYATAKLREGNLIRVGEETWENRTRRLLQNFGLSDRTRLVWYESASLLGTVKEGVALGPQGLYQREGKQSTLVIPLEEIYAVKASGSKRATVFNLRNQSWNLPLSDNMVPLVADYVRTIQLGQLLRKLEEAQ